MTLFRGRNEDILKSQGPCKINNTGQFSSINSFFNPSRGKGHGPTSNFPEKEEPSWEIPGEPRSEEHSTYVLRHITDNQPCDLSGTLIS